LVQPLSVAYFAFYTKIETELYTLHPANLITIVESLCNIYGCAVFHRHFQSCFFTDNHAKQLHAAINAMLICFGM
jgi:hypothetical protein